MHCKILITSILSCSLRAVYHFITLIMYIAILWKQISALLTVLTILVHMEQADILIICYLKLLREIGEKVHSGSQ